MGEVSTIETTDGDSDREFLLACQAGDLQAFSALYSRHASTVMRYAWSRTGDRKVVMGNFLAAPERLPSGCPSVSLPAATVCSRHRYSTWKH